MILKDITAGVSSMIDGLTAAFDTFDIDLVVGTDSGGDALARGTESGLESHLSDATGVGPLESLPVETSLGVIGFGSDVDFTIDELTAGIVWAADRDALLGAWGITPRTQAEMQALIEDVTTEASHLPVTAARGESGQFDSRNGTRTVASTPARTVTSYFDPAVVAVTTELVAPVRESDGIESIVTAFDERGMTTGIHLEAARLGNHYE